MSIATIPKATIADLEACESKAELVDGRLLEIMPTGWWPNRIGFQITSSLDRHVDVLGFGEAFCDNMGFTVARLISGRESFSPDAAFYSGKPPANLMRFIRGAPSLAVEVRSESDYGPHAEDQLQAKRADYFEAGTLVVWDVDPKAELVRVYRASSPETPATFAIGDIAEAEPAVPGWRMPVAEIFKRRTRDAN